MEAVAAKSSQWVRATAASGDADYVGVVAWSGELGFGVKPAEHGQDAPPPAEADDPTAGLTHGSGEAEAIDDGGHD